MGLLDRLGSDNEDTGDDTPDFYRVVKKTPKGGWKAVDGFDEMTEPVDKDTFEYNASPLDPGEYRLFEVVDNLNRQPQSGVGWTLQIDGDDSGEERDDQIESLKSEIRALRSDSEASTQADPQELVEQQKANLQLAALQSEDFIRKYGDELVLSMFGGDGSAGGGSESSIGYDDWQENPVGASLYETMNMMREDPDQVERLGEAIGRGVGTFVGGAADGYSGADRSLDDVTEAVDGAAADADAADSPDDDPTPDRNLDAGPADLSDLGAAPEAADTETLAANIAEARTTARRAGPGEQDRPEDAPHTPDDTATDSDDTRTSESDTDDTPDDAPPVETNPSKPMSAGPTTSGGESTSDADAADERADDIAEAL
jgi:hypothetical protein